MDTKPYIAYGASSSGRFEDYDSALEFAMWKEENVEYAPR